MHISVSMRYLLTFLTLCFIVFAAVYVSQGQNSDATEKSYELVKKLSGYIVPTVQVGGASYTIEGGIVRRNGVQVPPEKASPALRVAYLSVLTRLQPIFALEGTDPKKLSISVTRLRDSLQRVASLYDAETQKQFMEGLYPVSFLEKLSDVETLRQTVIIRPTNDSVEAYLETLQDVLHAYQDSIQKSRTALANIDQLATTTQSATFGFAAGGSSVKTVLSSLDALDFDAATALTRVSARLSCFKTGSECETLVVPYADFDVDTVGASSTPTSLEKHVRAILSVYNNGRYGIQPDGSPAYTELGVISMAKTACLPWPTKTRFLVWTVKRTETSPTFQFQPLNDIYLIDLRDVEHLKMYDKIRNEKVYFLLQGVSNLYECIDSGLDATRVATLYALAVDAREHPIFSQDVSKDPLIARATQLEHALASQTVIDETTVVQYIGALSALVQSRGEAELTKELPFDTVMEIERRIILYIAQSALFDQLIETAIKTNDVVAGYNGLFGFPSPPVLLFITRSYASLLFFASNKTVATTPVSFFKEKGDYLPNFQFATYSSLKDQYSDKSILELLRSGNKAYKNENIEL